MTQNQDYSGETLAVCCGDSNLHIWRPLTNTNDDINVVKSDANVSAASWNRNNKVIATARDNGTIELRYSNGALMTMLPRGGPSPHSEPLTSLSWSMGSKMLAAGSLSGNVFIHHMTAKTCTAHHISRSSHPITSLVYHPDDKFLAIAHDTTVSLWSPDMKTQLTRPLSHHNNSTSIHDDASIVSSLSIATIKPYIATATSSDSISLWDYKTQQQLFSSPPSSHTNTTMRNGMLQFCPLDAHLLWCARSDGTLVMYDLRSPLLLSTTTTTTTSTMPRPSVRICTGSTGLTCIDIRESYSHVAVGTVDGTVLLYDPRQTYNSTSAAAYTLDCNTSNSNSNTSSSRGRAVTCVHWQHTYQSISNAAKSYYLDSNNTSATSIHTNTAITDHHHHRGGHINTTTTANTTTMNNTNSPINNDRLSFVSYRSGRPSMFSTTSSTMHHVDPPRKLDLSPIPSLHGLLSTNEKKVVVDDGDDDYVLQKYDHDGRYNKNDTMNDENSIPVCDNNTMNNNYINSSSSSSRSGVHASPSMHSAVSVDKAMIGQKTHSSSNGTNTDGNNNNHTTTTTTNFSPSKKVAAPLTTTTSPTTTGDVDHRRHHPINNHTTSTGNEVWTIPARSPTKKLNTTYNNNSHNNNSDATTSSSSKDIKHMHTKNINNDNTTTTTTTTTTTSDHDDTYPLRNDILALHLDMLTQFKEQQAATERLIGSMMDRQNELMDEVKSLKNQLQTLLSRRDDVMWL